MGKVGETPGVAAPINPKYLHLFHCHANNVFTKNGVFQAPINRYW